MVTLSLTLNKLPPVIRFVKKKQKKKRVLSPSYYKI